MKLTGLTKYYITFFLSALFLWSAMSYFQIEFPNILFFFTAYVWHFALLAPGLKEKVFRGAPRFSFLTIVIKMNYYLQLFIHFKKFPFLSSFVRALSPFLFTLLLFVVGGSGNIAFTCFGSLTFELIYFFAKKTKLAF